MTFQETTEFLYKQVPVFQHSGANAYKPGLGNTNRLDEYFKYPHHSYKTIHVGGTNGKGSCSHTLAAILQEAGYKVGLYTSPHLVDFRERIRVNGKMIPEKYVIDFVAENFENVKDIHPSFFELTMMMAFCYFRDADVDVAIIEVGLGGRLDSTNVITPELSVITNISFDHVQFLGDTYEKIAYEKAGIIKENIPCVIGEYTSDTKDVFLKKASEVNSPILFAQDEDLISDTIVNNDGKRQIISPDFGKITMELNGDCQIHNAKTILASLNQLKARGFNIPDSAVLNGFLNVCELTGLQGRWQKVGESPLSYCDTGHNAGGIKYIAEQLKRQKYKTLRIVLGMVNDKDINSVLALLPKDAVYYFTKASVARALNEKELKNLAENHDLKGNCYSDVAHAYKAAINDSDKDDFIFTGGSNFIIADLLIHLNK